MTCKALVLDIVRPVVAHAEGQWQVQVLFKTSYRANDGTMRVKPQKRWVFMSARPQLHSWIDVRLL